MLFHHGQIVGLTKSAFTPLDPGTYTVRYYAVDSGGNIGTAAYTIEVSE
jgi:hypothetical protein